MDIGSEGLPHQMWQLFSISFQCDSAGEVVCSNSKAKRCKQSPGTSAKGSSVIGL